MKTGSTVVGTDGKWKVELSSLEASENETLTIQSGDQALIYEDVAVGEVWVAGGQSNMEFWMRYEKHKEDAMKDCPNKRLRFYDVPEVCYDGQIQEFDYSRQGIWREMTADNLEYFSAVGYYFQKEIEQALDVPVGIIGCNWGGTPSCSWMNPDTVKKVGNPWMIDYEERISSMDMTAYWENQHHNPMNDKGNPFADPFNEFCLPRTPSDEELMEFFSKSENDWEKIISILQPQSIPGSLYEHMLKQISPYGIKGFLWYQGESDDAPGKNVLYKDMLSGLISDWRALWGNENLPFLLVQLPGYESWMANTQKNQYPIIRKCQENVADTVEQTWMCSISDAGEERDIHPKNKKVVGERLALLARGHVYGETILVDAPRAKMAVLEENVLKVTFQHAQGGMKLMGQAIEALEVFEDETSIPYTAEVDGEQIIIRLETVPQGTVKVQFAQTSWYKVNLYNQADIPAVPFEFVCN